jgi:hypothetical protein
VQTVLMSAGVLPLPSGKLVRGRGLRKPLPPGPQPDFALYLCGREPLPVEWESRWLRWPDFWLPTDRPSARPCANCWNEPRPNASRSPVAAGSAARAQPWRASPCSTACPTTRRSPKSARTTRGEPSRHLGRSASSPASRCSPRAGARRQHRGLDGCLRAERSGTVAAVDITHSLYYPDGQVAVGDPSRGAGVAA